MSVVSQNCYYGHFNDMNCNAIVIWWYEKQWQTFYTLCLKKEYVITLSFTLMEYIKNGNWIEFNNIMLDTLIFTRHTVVILLLCVLSYTGRSTHFNYTLQNKWNDETKRKIFCCMNCREATKQETINLEITSIQGIVSAT